MGIKANRRDIIWNYIGIFFSMGANFIMLPFMLHFLSSDSIGLWYVYQSLGGIAALFDFGFNPTFARNMAYCWSGAKELQQNNVKHLAGNEPNYQQMAALMKTSKIIYFIIAFVSFVLLAVVGSIYVAKISSGLNRHDVIISWATFVLAVFLNLYYGYYASFLRGIGAIEKYNQINVGARIAQIIISVFLMFVGFGIISVSVAYLLYALIIRVFSKRTFWNYREMKKELARYSSEVTRKHVGEMFNVVWHNAWRDGLVTVSRYVSNQAGTLIASAFLTLTETGVYSLIVQLITAILTIGGGIYSALQPEWQSAYVANDKETLRKDTGLVMTMHLYVAVLGVLVLVTVGPNLIGFFKPEMQLDRMMIIGLAFYLFMYNRTSYYASFISNMNMVPYAFAFIVSGMAGVLLAYIMIRFTNFGVWAIVIGQFIPQGLYNFWKWPKMILDYLEINLRDVVSIGTIEIRKKINGIFGKKI